MRSLRPGLALLLNLLLFFSGAGEDRGPGWLHPVPPPLTRIEALGEQTLGPDAPEPPRGEHLLDAMDRLLRQPSSDNQRRAMAAARALLDQIRPLADENQRLRLAVEQDALALAQVLGSERLAVVVAQKESLADRVGEGWLWRDVIDRVRQ